MWQPLCESMSSTVHRLINGDARDLSFLDDESVHLVVTSPPYWNLKRYNETPDQLGHIQDYESFLRELEKVWRHVYRVLVPGGRLVCVVGDVCVARRDFGRHLVFPLHADICVICRRIGFDNLNPIIWHKIANASYEVANGSKFLGKPYEPNAIIKNDMEFILMHFRSISSSLKIMAFFYTKSLTKSRKIKEFSPRPLQAGPFVRRPHFSPAGNRQLQDRNPHQGESHPPLEGDGVL